MGSRAASWNPLSHPRALARAHGAFNIVGGAWPLLSLRSFEMVFGPKRDRWLEYTVSGLLVVNGAAQVAAAQRDEVGTARQLGWGTAATLLAIDAVFVPRGTIRPTYLVDAVFEAGWIYLWARCRMPPEPSGTAGA
jgi:hypothetical protein